MFVKINHQKIYIMKNFTSIILFAISLISCTLVQAQEQSKIGKFRIFEGVTYTIKSPNGEWIGYSNDGTVAIYNIISEEEYIYEKILGESFYVLQTINNDGKAAGSLNYLPAYWTPENEWKELPIGDGENNGTCNAEQVFQDGSFIVGNIDKKINDFNFWIPVIWYYNNETQNYDEPVILPYQEKDPVNMQPQGIYIRGGITDDGSQFSGRFIDWSGTNYYPVIWKNTDGKNWEQKMMFVDQLVNLDEEIPIFPELTAEYPDAYNFMNDEEKNAYDEAMKAYNDSLNIYFETGNMDYVPKYNPEVYKDSYFSNTPDGQERKAEYNQALEEYNKAAEEFNQKFMEYGVKYDLFFKDTIFTMTDMHMNNNGKYMATRCMYSPDKINNLEVPVLLDLENEEIHFVPTPTTTVPFAVLNDGTVFHYGPIFTEEAKTYVWKIGMKESITIEEWLKSQSQEAYENITENLSKGLGIVTSKGKGNILMGYPDALSPIGAMTWLADLSAYDDYTGIDKTYNKPAINIWFDKAAERINVIAEKTDFIQLYDIEGKLINMCTGSNFIDINNVANGIYIVKIKSDNTIAIRKMNIVR